MIITTSIIIITEVKVKVIMLIVIISSIIIIVNIMNIFTIIRYNCVYCVYPHFYNIIKLLIIIKWKFIIIEEFDGHYDVYDDYAKKSKEHHYHHHYDDYYFCILSKKCLSSSLLQLNYVVNYHKVKDHYCCRIWWSLWFCKIIMQKIVKNIIIIIIIIMMIITSVFQAKDAAFLFLQQLFYYDYLVHWRLSDCRRSSTKDTTEILPFSTTV